MQIYAGIDAEAGFKSHPRYQLTARTSSGLFFLRPSGKPFVVQRQSHPAMASVIQHYAAVNESTAVKIVTDAGLTTSCGMTTRRAGAAMPMAKAN
jgi:hypothetical protein